MPGRTTRGTAEFRAGVTHTGYIGDMTRPVKLEAAVVDAWVAKHPGWSREGAGAIVCTFTFPDFAAALAFVVRVGCAAEKHDHHPDVALGWGKARIFWSTHDAGGVTQLDLDAAEACDRMRPAEGGPTARRAEDDG
jgi:4a-hydroxytetrahydrobiopterin dehydratase